MPTLGSYIKAVSVLGNTQPPPKLGNLRPTELRRKVESLSLLGDIPEHELDALQTCSLYQSLREHVKTMKLW